MVMSDSKYLLIDNSIYEIKNEDINIILTMTNDTVIKFGSYHTLQRDIIKMINDNIDFNDILSFCEVSVKDTQMIENIISDKNIEFYKIIKKINNNPDLKIALFRYGYTSNDANEYILIQEYFSR